MCLDTPTANASTTAPSTPSASTQAQIQVQTQVAQQDPALSQPHTPLTPPLTPASSLKEHTNASRTSVGRPDDGASSASGSNVVEVDGSAVRAVQCEQLQFQEAIAALNITQLPLSIPGAHRENSLQTAVDPFDTLPVNPAVALGDDLHLQLSHGRFLLVSDSVTIKWVEPI